MLRGAIQRSAYRNCYGLHCVPPRRLVCALCQTHPQRRLNSTAAVAYSLKGGPAKPGDDAMDALLQQRQQRQQQKQLTKGKEKERRKAEALLSPAKLPKEKGKRNGEASPSPAKVPKEKVKAKPAWGSNGNRKPKKVVTKVAPRDVETSGRKFKVAGMSIREAMSPRGTTVLLEKSGLSVHDLEIEPIPVENQPEVATISHGLDRVLFNPGVVYLQDPRSRVFNFDPYLQQIMPVTEFDFDATNAFTTSSQDTKLEAMTKKHGKKYMGSTSSMTSVLSHFHYLLSAWRPPNLDMLSKSFTGEFRSFTQLSRLPTSIFLRYKGDGTYAIDSDKEWDGDNVLSFMGRSMEKMLTLPPETFEKYRRTNSHTLSEEDRNEPETYHYSVFGDFMMRSQLDAHDPRLPGTGTFDLKTRAVVAVRVDVSNFHMGAGYQIKTTAGTWESFEREYSDMIRAAFLKYSMQVRMGKMDGIFVAFHNTEKIFGFQYISLDEMDAALHEGPNSGIGAQEFKMSLLLWNKVLNQAVERFPRRSLRLHFETRETAAPFMYVFGEPMDEERIEEIQRGERGTVAEFMESVKEKMRSVEETHNAPAAAESESESEPGETEEPVLGTENPTTVTGDEAGRQEVAGGVDAAEEQTALETEEGEEEEKAEEAAKEPAASETGQEDVDAEESAAGETEEEAVDAAAEPAVGEAEEEDVDAEEEAAVSETEWQDQEFATNEIEADMQSDEQAGEGVVQEGHKDEGAAKELFAITLSIKSFVNGVKCVRPNHLAKGDRWEVAYSVGQFSSPEKARSIYNALRERQKKLAPSLRSADADGLGSYHQHIRTLSNQGRTWQKEQNEMDAGKEKVVYKTRP